MANVAEAFQTNHPWEPVVLHYIKVQTPNGQTATINQDSDLLTPVTLENVNGNIFKITAGSEEDVRAIVADSDRFGTVRMGQGQEPIPAWKK
jgi:hypothetical protein